jgi:glycine C-acetyltransferase
MIQTIGSLKRLNCCVITRIKDKFGEKCKCTTKRIKHRNFNIGDTNTCVTPVYLEGSVPEAMIMVNDLRENYGIFLSIVIYPVIPKGFY